METTINDKLILDRTVKQLQQSQASLQDKIDRMEREQLALLDAKMKLQKELTELDGKKSQTLKEINQEKTAWTAQKNSEYTELKDLQTQSKKILAREDYVTKTEQDLKKKLVEAVEQNRLNSVKELELKDKESVIPKKIKEADDYVVECKKIGDKIKDDLELLKDRLIKEISAWQMK